MKKEKIYLLFLNEVKEIDGIVNAARSFILFENEAAVVGYRFCLQQFTPINLISLHSLINSTIKESRTDEAGRGLLSLAEPSTIHRATELEWKHFIECWNGMWRRQRSLRLITPNSPQLKPAIHSQQIPFHSICLWIHFASIVNELRKSNNIYYNSN